MSDPSPGPTPGDTRALLFDLGGVIVDLDFDRVFARWAELAGTDAGAIRSRWSMDDAYERHERGEIDGTAYFAGLRDTLGVDLTADQLVDGWNAVFIGLIDGVAELLAELAPRVPLYGLTNSNPTHAEHWATAYAPELASFRTVFVSSSIGARKPEPEVFAMVADRIGVPVGSIHFFDDSPVNVDGARAAGMPATLVTSFDQMAAAVRSIA